MAVRIGMLWVPIILVAGLVEYNFGDSEITLLIWIAIGLALQLGDPDRKRAALNLAA